MFALPSLAAVPVELADVYAKRIGTDVYRGEVATIRGPVGLFIVRDDGAAGSKLATEVVRSFGYWHERSGHFFDGIFLGWGYDGVPAFDEKTFVRCIADLEGLLKWRYSGGADLILTDFVFDVPHRTGTLDFSRCVPLDISALLEEKKLVQLGKLMEQLITPVSKDRLEVRDTSVWEISDYIAVLRTREFFWKTLMKRIGDVLGWIDAVAPYTVRDLRRR